MFVNRLIFLAGLLLGASCTYQIPYIAIATTVGTVVQSTGLPSVVRNSRPYILAEQSRIYADDIISTDGYSLVKILMNSGSTVELGTQARMRLMEVATNGSNTRTQLSLSTGSLEISATSDTDDFTINTNIARIESISASFWLGYADGGKSLDVISLGGTEVQISNRGGEVTLTTPLTGTSVTAGSAPQGIVAWSENKFRITRNNHRVVSR